MLKKIIYKKKIYTFDTFNGYTTNDINYVKNQKLKDAYIKNMKRWCINEKIVYDKIKANSLEDKIKIIKGDISQTIRQINDEKISLIYIDCNVFLAAFNALEYLHKKIVNSCFIIVDEHCIGGETEALEKYIQKYNVKGELFKLDTNYKTGPRIIFHINKSLTESDNKNWKIINNFLNKRYKKVLKLGNINKEDVLKI